MPVGADTPAQAARKFHRLADDVKHMDRRIAVAGAQIVKREVKGTLRRAAPRGRLNVGKRGAKVGVRYDPLPSGSVLVRMTGPAHLIERNTKAHRIPKEMKGRGRSRRRNIKPIVIPNVGVRASVQHPGTKGKFPWRKGVDAARPKIGKAGVKVMRETMRKALR